MFKKKSVLKIKDLSSSLRTLTAQESQAASGGTLGVIVRPDAGGTCSASGDCDSGTTLHTLE